MGSLPDQTDPDGLVSDGTQGAWMVLLAETLPLQKSAGALLHLLRTGYVKPVDESAELQVRASDVSRKSGSHAASNRSLQLEDCEKFLSFVAHEKLLELYSWLGPPS